MPQFTKAIEAISIISNSSLFCVFYLQLWSLLAIECSPRSNGSGTALPPSIYWSPAERPIKIHTCPPQMSSARVALRISLSFSISVSRSFALFRPNFSIRSPEHTEYAYILFKTMAAVNGNIHVFFF